MENLTKISGVILATIKEAHLGKLGLVSVLKGYKSKQIMQKKLYNLPGYGALYWLTPDGIKDVLRQMESAGMIETADIGPQMGTYFRIPKVRLTKAGETALQEKIGVPLLIDPLKRELPRKSDTVEMSVALFKQHHSVERVAGLRSLKEDTVWKHLEAGIQLELIAREEVLPERIIQQVRKAREKKPDARLNELKEMLPDISYAELRCALAEDIEHREQ